ncbi:LuxR C-terminal-related transcriptional regulator [Kamptonema cortianum]|nr:LuxR C-terminal-related transcriptional regulator [Kamptonema cortianum]
MSRAIRSNLRMWLVVDCPNDINLGALLTHGSAELIDHRSLRLSSVALKAALDKIPSPFRKLVADLSVGWPVALLLIGRWAQSTELENINWNETEIVEASGLAGFIDETISPHMRQEQLHALVHASLVSEVDLSLGDLIDPASRRHLVTASLSLAGLVTRLGNKLLLQPAFRAWLRGRFDDLPIVDQEAAIERAAAILASQGHLSEAGRLLNRCRQEAKIADLVKQSGSLRIWIEHGYSVIKELVDQAGHKNLKKSISLQLMKCIVLMKSGRILEAEKIFLGINTHSIDEKDILRDHEIIRVTLLVYGCMLQRESDLANFKDMITGSNIDPGLHSLLSTLSCILHTQRARFDAAQASLIAARVSARSASSNYNLMFLSMHEASMLLAKGELRLAKVAISDARKRWRDEFPEDKGAETVLFALNASLEYELGQITSARTSVRKSAFRMPDSEAWFDIYVAAYEPMARIIVLEHGTGPAMEALETQRSKLIAHGLPRVANLVQNMMHVITGEHLLRTGSALVGVKADDVASIDLACTWQEKEMHTLATFYALMGEGRAAFANECACNAAEAAEQGGLLRSALRYRMARVGGLVSEGRIYEAEDEAARALALGVKQGAKQVFVHHYTPEIAAILTSVANADRAGDSGLSRFVSSLGFRQDGDIGKLGPLTQREKEVLSALSEGGSDKVLGRVLGISEHGVRFHLKSIYRKLEVGDRASAVHKGRMTGQI